MANALTAAVPLMAFRALEVLRENSVVPRLVMNASSDQGIGYGQDITINDLDPLETRAVTPGAVFPDAGVNTLTATAKTISMTNWREVPYYITDAEVFDIQQGIWPRAFDEAVRALANKIDTDLLTAIYQKSYETVGTAGVTPFQNSFVEAQQASRVLSTAKAPKEDRFFVVDEFAAANIIGLPQLINVNQAGTNTVAVDGSIEGVKRVGFTWHEDQNTLTHTPGVQAGDTVAIDAAGVVGDTTIVIDNGAGAGPSNLPVVGDKFTIAGSTQKYTVLAVTDNAPTANEATLTIQPALDQVIADGDLVSFETTPFVGNVFFHRSAVGFASRPLNDDRVRSMMRGTAGQTKASETVVDPISGITFRVEVVDLYKQVAVCVDALYGFELLRPSLAGVCYG